MAPIKWREYVRSQLPPLNVSPERELEIGDELAIQLEATYDRARARGLGEDEARQLAFNEIPDWAAFARSVGRIERPYTQPPAPGAGHGSLMSGIPQDLRYAFRALSRAPGFAAVSILTLALGIAATTVVYSIVDGILLRPLPIADPDRVLMARESINGQDMSLSWPNYQDWRARQTTFDRFAAWRGLTANLTGVERPRRLNVRHVTWDLLATLGVQPVVGRDFRPEDDTIDAPRTAIVSYAFWQRELGGTPAAIGKTIMLDETPATVIGVMPQGFTVAREEDVFLTIGAHINNNPLMYSGRGNHFGLAAIGRLKPDATVESANAEMAALARQLEQEYPNTNSGNGGSARPLFEVLVGSARSMLYVLFGAVITMLLIACANLANLMLARAAGRAQEMAVRRALGAARWRIGRQMLTESLLLAVIGGTLGVAGAYAGFAGLLALLPPNQPRIHIIAIDWRVLLVAMAASIGTGVLFGLAPAIQAATGRSMSLLRGSRVTGTGPAAGTRRTLMFAEVALALILVTGAGLMLRTMNNLASVDTGYSGEHIVSAQFNLPARYDATKRLQFLDQSLERLRAIPGVTHASFTYSIPIAGSNWNSIFTIEGQPVPERSQLPSSAWIPITQEYFETMGIRLLKGRWFDGRDQTAAPLAVIVNETFARRFFGNSNPLGARVKLGWPEDTVSPLREIVGVVADTRQNSLQGDPTLQGYLPVRQVNQRSGHFVVRTSGNAATLGRAIEAAIHDIDPNLPLFNIQTMDQVVDAAIGNQRLTVVLLMGFAGLALLIAAVGVFGVTAYSVTQRTHELGVRMALGARRGNVLALVLRQEMSACLVGIAAGVIGALFLGSLLESLLFGVAATDTVTIALASVTLLVVTAIACVVPARRATRVDPVTALRPD
jgi:putative ABC transport system permease protein